MLLLHHSLTQVGFSCLSSIRRPETAASSRRPALLTPCHRFGPRNLVSFLSGHGEEIDTLCCTCASYIKDYNGTLRAFSSPVIYLVATK